MTTVPPVIKWSGSKRSQAAAICSHIRRDYGVYYEPFCGSCAMLAYILSNLPERFSGFACSDLNEDLINSYLAVRDRPGEVAEGYSERWHWLNDGNSIDRKRDRFEEVRARLNAAHDPLDFIFIMRTTTNGMPRYNRGGEFNNSFHVTRSGIDPATFGGIVRQWSAMLSSHGVEFSCRSYSEVNPGEDDLLYMDPPYAATKGMYFGGFDAGSFFDWLAAVRCDWMLSYDGVAGDQNLIAPVPERLYRRHLLVESGNSSFRRVIGNDRHCDVRESLYLNFDDAVGDSPENDGRLF